MASRITLSFVDYGGEVSTVGAFFPTINSGNITAQTGLMDDLRDAIEGVSLCNLQKDARLLSETKFAVGNATNPFAQRELKWHVSMVDTNGNDVSMEIPGADLALLSPNTDTLDITTTEGAALVAAIEAGQKSNDGESVTFVSAYVVGRSL